MAPNLMLVAGARPNFMKIAPLYRELTKVGTNLEPSLVHTGQHYDYNMSGAFFRDLGLPRPAYHLGVGSGSHSHQTAGVMEAFEKVIDKARPDAVIVVGDVNSTLACALVTAKMNYGIPGRSRPLIVHVEAGLRSFDDSMPEEINRKLTDSLSDVLFVSEPSGIDNLKKEGFNNFIDMFDDKYSQTTPPLDNAPSYPLTVLVGNVMIDCLFHMLPEITKRDPFSTVGLERKGEKPLLLVTIHRPSNVDNPERFNMILETLSALASDAQVLFPVHPRTRQKIMTMTDTPAPDLHLIEPVGYLDFLALQKKSNLIITDSGGIQEESTALGVPCITIRENTERPITITEGTNQLVPISKEAIWDSARSILSGKKIQGKCPKIWDGKAAERIVSVLDCLL